MKLPDVKSKYIKRFKNRLIERAFIIDAMAEVGDRPMVLVSESDIDKSKKHVLEIGKYINQNIPNDFDNLMDETTNSVNIPSTEQYDPPAKELPAEYKDDEVMKWRATSGIEIIHRQHTPYELIRNYNNWLLMDEAKRKQSDEMCLKHNYYTNHDYFKVLLEEFKKKGEFTEGDIVDLVVQSTKSTCRCYLDKIEDDKLSFIYLDNGSGRPFGEVDTFSLSKGDIENYNGKTSIETTVGRYLLNYLLLAYPFKDHFPYFNTKWDADAIEKQMADDLLNDKITVEQFKKYENNLFFIGHFSELCVPALSKKSLGTDPNIAKIKKELFEKYKGRLTDPLVIAEIEDKLIAIDKAHLKDDSSMRFYGALGGKAFNIARKKMYLTVGGIETFSKDSGKYDFLPNSLAEGWDKNYIPTIANEIRKGSYNRGFETQLGGVQTKLITRIFQDLAIYLPDCNTTRGLLVDFDRFSAKDYIGRWVKTGSTWTLIEESNLSKFKGTQTVRSPMFCNAPKGLCYKCSGEVFRKLNIKQLAAVEIDISTTFLLLSMKNMHGSKLEVLEIKDLDPFII